MSKNYPFDRPRKRISPRWDTHLDAADLVKYYYKILDLVTREGGFKECHIFEGRPPHCIVNVGPQICSTPGCINPRHWTNQREMEDWSTKRITKASMREYVPSRAEMVELLDYYMEMPPFPKKNYVELRAAIPPEILTDNQILEMINASGDTT